MKSSRILILMFLSVIITANQLFSQTNIDTTVITKVIKVPNPENACISVSNSSDSLSIFTLKLNNKFFSSAKEITDEIKRMAGPTNDSLFYYAWDFLCANSFSHDPLSNGPWTTTLTLYFNSIGYSNNKFQANILSKLWNLLGYETRIWNLNGHIVPEVLYKSRWQMLDPQYHVCYLNDNHMIANVEELVKNPAWTEDPKRTIINSSEIQYTGKYVSRIAKYYDSANADKGKMPPECIDSFNFYLPPHSKIIFPGVFVKNLKSSRNLPVKFYANCKMIIPPAWQGIIKNNLVIAKIIGNGSINIGNEEFQIGSSELDTLLTRHEKFISEIIVNKIRDSLEIIYLMNPYMSEIKDVNTLTISGRNIECLAIGSLTIPDSNSIPKLLKKNYFYEIKKRYDVLIGDIRKNLVCIDTNEITSKEMFLEQLEAYFNCIYRNEKGKKKYIKEIMQKMKFAFSQLPEDYPWDRLLFFTNRMPKVIMFYDFEYGDPNDLLRAFKRRMVGHLK